jgi:uncharacterized protein (TIGR04552 family)
LLSGGSVVDWHKLSFTTMEDVERFLGLMYLDMGDTLARERLRYVFNEAVSYAEEHLRLRLPKYLRDPENVCQVFLWASQTDGFRRRQILSCVILKLMHVINHMEAADLKFKAPIAEEHLFDLAEEIITQRAREMREKGLPVLSFYGSRKTRSSVISKLIAKKENVAATIWDKLRFRIIVYKRQDLYAVLQHMTQHVFPFNYVIPGQTHNNLVSPDDFVDFMPNSEGLQELVEAPQMQTGGKNEFSGASYQMINFIADFPVRLPPELTPGFGFELGQVVFLKVEFQLLDEETMRLNEEGENAHHLYKGRQTAVVSHRLLRGGIPEPKD